MEPVQASNRQAGSSSQQEKRKAESNLASKAQPKRRALGNLPNVQVCAAKASNCSNAKRIKPNIAVELDQIQPITKRTRAASNAQNKESLARQTSTTETAKSGTSLKVSTAQSSPEEDIQSIGEGSVLKASNSLVPAGIVDCDRDNRNNLIGAHNYADDIFEYLKQRESLYEINYYLDHQPELNKNMRSVLVDWIAELQQTQGLYPETLFLAVKITDAYLEKERIAKDQLQLLGTVALWIACKYEDHQTLIELLDISDNQYEKQEMLKMEKSILQGINFDLGFPLSLQFLRRYAQARTISLLTLTRI